MSWIEKIRQKPQEQKIRLIWTVIIISVIVLIIIWVIAAKFSKNLSVKAVFQNIGSNMHQEQDFYKQDLKKDNIELKDRFHWFK